MCSLLCIRMEKKEEAMEVAEMVVEGLVVGLEAEETEEEGLEVEKGE